MDIYIYINKVTVRLLVTLKRFLVKKLLSYPYIDYI